MTTVETGILKLLWDMVHALIKGHHAKKREFFKDHVEPLQTRIVEVHKDYVA